MDVFTTKSNKPFYTDKDIVAYDLMYPVDRPNWNGKPVFFDGGMYYTLGGLYRSRYFDYELTRHPRVNRPAPGEEDKSVIDATLWEANTGHICFRTLAGAMKVKHNGEIAVLKVIIPEGSGVYLSTNSKFEENSWKAEWPQMICADHVKIAAYRKNGKWIGPGEPMK